MKMTNHNEEMCLSKNGTLFESAKCPFLALKMDGDNEVCINKNPCIFLSNSLQGRDGFSERLVRFCRLICRNGYLMTKKTAQSLVVCKHRTDHLPQSPEVWIKNQINRIINGKEKGKYQA